MTVELSYAYGDKRPGLSVMIAGKIRKGFLLYKDNLTAMFFYDMEI